MVWGVVVGDGLSWEDMLGRCSCGVAVRSDVECVFRRDTVLVVYCCRDERRGGKDVCLEEVLVLVCVCRCIADGSLFGV